VARGALAGAAGAAAWLAAEQGLSRVLRTGVTDLRLLGRPVAASRAWPVAGAAWHLANGAAFGAAFAALGGRGWRRGVAAALAEHAATWPGMALVDRLHPDVRDGRWPRLARNPRVFAQETVLHALFGAVLGAGTAHRKERPQAG
jgi:hypothetical protein